MKLKDFIRKSYLRPWDIAIIVLLTLSSFLPLVVFGMQQVQDSDVTKQAVLKVDGEVIKIFDLKEDGPTYTYKYEDKDGDYNIIEVSGERIRMLESNCGDQVCVQRGWISKPGETPIACLPHNLFITVEASDGSEDGSLIY
ncbi:NusG domain II-containing protein [Enterococcus sp. UD-01]|uniref:NusG domain II-containing protein n=1 Tax=Enterococcus sp. UD-01 TaxID=3373911 RepID=UPI00384E3FD1